MRKALTILASVVLASLLAYSALANTGKLKSHNSCYGEFHTITYTLNDVPLYKKMESHSDNPNHK